MLLLARSVAVMSLVAGILVAAPAQAVEAPLSRASFDRAVAEGRACERLVDAEGADIAARQPASGVVGATIEGLLQEAVSDADTRSYVTILLATPYTQARRAACDAKLTGGALDVEALWSRLRSVSTVSIWVETAATYEGNTIVTRDAMGDTSPPALTHPVAGPHVESVALRRGKDSKQAAIQSVAGGGGVDSQFPATALQGRGPFYAIIHMTSPVQDMAVKLKPSIVKLP